MSSIFHNTRKQGYRAFFRGNGANILRVVPFSAIVCVTYTHLIMMLPTDDEFDWLEPVYRMIGASLAGGCASLATYPLDLVRTRLASQVGGQGSMVSYKGVGHALRTIVREEGFRGAYRGIRPTLYAIVPFLACQRVSYDVGKMWLLPRLRKRELEPGIGAFLALGSVAGAVGTFFVHPFDLVRRRMQVQSSGFRLVEQASTLTAMRGIISNHGVRGLFVGLGAAYLRLIPAVSIAFVVQDWTLDYFREEEEKQMRGGLALRKKKA